jgi:uncharacterized membrane protein YoaK (UPF0700 family)
MLDGIGYLHLGGLFVSFMSGNSTRMASALPRDIGRLPSRLSGWSPPAA